MHVFWVMLVGVGGVGGLEGWVGGKLAIFFHEKLHSDYFHHFNSAPKHTSVFFSCFGTITINHLFSVSTLTTNGKLL